MAVDFTGGPRLNYWTVMNGQTVEYSGTPSDAPTWAKPFCRSTTTTAARFDRSIAITALPTRGRVPPARSGCWRSLERRLPGRNAGFLLQIAPLGLAAALLAAEACAV